MKAEACEDEREGGCCDIDVPRQLKDSPAQETLKCDHQLHAQGSTMPPWTDLYGDDVDCRNHREG